LPACIAKSPGDVPAQEPGRAGYQYSHGRDHTFVAVVPPLRWVRWALARATVDQPILPSTDVTESDQNSLSVLDRRSDRLPAMGTRLDWRVWLERSVHGGRSY
jgi:hypothetical protein